MSLKGYIVTGDAEFGVATAVFEVAAESLDEALALVQPHPAAQFYKKGLKAELDGARQIDLSGVTAPAVLRLSRLHRRNEV
jgi:hypothetical protein